MVQRLAGFGMYTCASIILCLGVTSHGFVASREEAMAEMEALSVSEHIRYTISPELWTQPIEMLPSLGGTFTEQAFIRQKLKMFHEGDVTKVYSLEDDPLRLMVYRVGCDFPGEFNIEPAVADYWFLRYLANTGVVPFAHAISKTLDPTVYGLDEGKISACAINTCMYPDTPLVRYTLVDRASGRTFEEIAAEFPSRRMPATIAARWGIIMMEGIRAIHSYNVFHGDLVATNIIANESEWKVKFIDFQSAQVFPGTDYLLRRNYIRNRSFRDDVIRIFGIIGTVIFGEKYSVYMSHRIDGVDPSSTGGRILANAVSSVPDFFTPANEQLTDLALSVARIDVLERPHYDAIIGTLRDIISSEETL